MGFDQMEQIGSAIQNWYSVPALVSSMLKPEPFERSDAENFAAANFTNNLVAAMGMFPQLATCVSWFHSKTGIHLYLDKQVPGKWMNPDYPSVWVIPSPRDQGEVFPYRPRAGGFEGTISAIVFKASLENPAEFRLQHLAEGLVAYLDSGLRNDSELGTILFLYFYNILTDDELRRRITEGYPVTWSRWNALVLDLLAPGELAPMRIESPLLKTLPLVTPLIATVVGPFGSVHKTILLSVLHSIFNYHLRRGIHEGQQP